MKTNILIGVYFVAFVAAFLAGETMAGAGLVISATILIAAKGVRNA